MEKEILVITKLSNILNLNSKEDIIKIKECYFNQPMQVRERINKEFLCEHTKQIYIDYLEEYFKNIITFFKNKNDKEFLEKGLNVGLSILAKIYDQARANISRDKMDNKKCTLFIKDITKIARNPEGLIKSIFIFTKIESNYKVTVEEIEEIKVEYKDNIEVQGDNILAIALGGGSDCVQATMVGKYLFSNKCKNVISIRTEKTQSQDEKGKINQKRKIYNPKEVIAEDIFLCDENTSGEGRFFENFPSEVGINVYLVIDKNDGNLTKKIELVMQHIFKISGKQIDTVLGVDTGGDCLYPKIKKRIKGEIATPDQDRLGLEAINKIKQYGVKVYNCIVAPGIDTPNGITTSILQYAQAYSYMLNSEERKEILKRYLAWKMDGSNAKTFGKTSLIWQSALKKERGLITVNIPVQNVLNDKSPWIPTVCISDITECVVFMETEKLLGTLERYER